MKIKTTDIENLATAILHRMPFTAALPTAAAGSHRWILSTGFSLSIYDFFLPPDIKGLNARRYLSLVVSTQWLHIVSTLLNTTLINFSQMLCHKVINTTFWRKCNYVVTMILQISAQGGTKSGNVKKMFRK